MVRPTHVCKICGAFWKEWNDAWSLISRECGECCDNAAMGDQIELLVDCDQHGKNIEFKSGWLRRQLDRAKKEIESWSPEKKALIPK